MKGSFTVVINICLCYLREYIKTIFMSLYTSAFILIFDFYIWFVRKQDMAFLVT